MGIDEHSALNLFDGIVYINLDMRKDRKKSIEEEFKKVSVDPNKTFRIAGHYDELNGTRGCVTSHIKALDLAIERKWKNVLILEDDCAFIKNQNEINAYIRNFLEHFKNEWDVFFLGTKIIYCQKTDHKAYVKIVFSLCAHAYVVNEHYMLPLRDHYISIQESMKNDLFFADSLKKAHDRRWVDLQLSDRWFSGMEIIAEQREFFSDIEKIVKGSKI